MHANSGYRGSSFDRGKWRATICFQGESFHLGRYIDLAQARAAYTAALGCVKTGLPLLANDTRNQSQCRWDGTPEPTLPHFE